MLQKSTSAAAQSPQQTTLSEYYVNEGLEPNLKPDYTNKRTKLGQPTVISQSDGLPSCPKPAAPTSDLLERIATFSEQTRPYTARAAAIAIIGVCTATALRFAVGHALVDPGFSLYVAAIMATGLLAGIPASIGAAAVSIFIVTWAFTPPYFAFEWPSFSDQLITAFAALASVVTICFAQCCRLVLQRMRARELTNEMLVRELNHRERNLFSITQLIVRKSLMDQQQRAEEILGRLGAIHQANERLTNTTNIFHSIGSLVSHEFAAYGHDRVVIRGPEIFVGPARGRHLLLLFHELTTNAAKYGALSRPAGRVSVDWRWNGHQQVTLNWKECGGSTATPPSREGFGSKLMSVCVTALEGTMEPQFLAEGYSCRITFRIK